MRRFRAEAVYRQKDCRYTASVCLRGCLFFQKFAGRHSGYLFEDPVEVSGDVEADLIGYLLHVFLSVGGQFDGTDDALAVQVVAEMDAGCIEQPAEVADRQSELCSHVSYLEFLLQVVGHVFQYGRKTGVVRQYNILEESLRMRADACLHAEETDGVLVDVGVLQLTDGGNEGGQELQVFRNQRVDRIDGKLRLGL